MNPSSSVHRGTRTYVSVRNDLAAFIGLRLLISLLLLLLLFLVSAIAGVISMTRMQVLIVAAFLLRAVTAGPWTVQVEQDSITLHMNEATSISFLLNSTADPSNFTLTALSERSIATVNLELVKQVNAARYGILNITGIFLGNTKVSISAEENGVAIGSQDVLTVMVVREERAIDTAFTVAVAVLVSVLYVNFGCAIDWDVCRSTLARPIGPAIGFFCQFAFMPPLSYAIGYLLFPEQPELQLGLFFTGISPSGGASNIWTVLLGGNLNLSVTMTTLCTIAAFGTMPFWIFTLGSRIFERGQIVIPYYRIAIFVIGLVIPLGIGFCVQRKFPPVSKALVRMMKPFSIVLIIFIIIFAILTNLYLFQLFSMQVIAAGMALPWTGFAFGLLVGFIFKRPYPDVKAIAIETGIQNTGVAIFLLRFTLQKPADDLTTVIPVCAAIMTPIPLMILYLAKLVHDRRRTRALRSVDGPSLEKLQGTTEISTIARPYQS